MEGAKIIVFVYRRSVRVKQSATSKSWERAVLNARVQLPLGTLYPSCPLSIQHPPRIPILPPFSMLLWRLTNVRLTATLASHPLLPCDCPEAILTVLREQIPASSQPQNRDELTKWDTPTVNVLLAFFATLGEVVGLVNIGMFPREMFGPMLAFFGFLTWRGITDMDSRDAVGWNPCMSRHRMEDSAFDTRRHAGQCLLGR